MTRDAYREQVVGKLNAAAESAGRKVVRPEDLRPGDRVRPIDVRAAFVVERVDLAKDEIVSRTDGSCVAIGQRVSTLNPDWTRTWELIERPKPEARLGSVWVDPETGREWVALRGGRYAQASESPRFLGPDSGRACATIARLVPAEGEA